MDIKEILLSNKTCSFQIDQRFNIVGYSDNLRELLSNVSKQKTSFKDLIRTLFLDDTFYNEKYFYALQGKIETAFQNHHAVYEPVVVSNNYNKAEFYHFTLGIDFIHSTKDYLFIRFDNFILRDSIKQVYEDMFITYEDTFDVFGKNDLIGKFVVDYSVSKHHIYANPQFAKLLQVPVSHDNYYLLTRYHDKFEGKNVLIRELAFFKRTDMLIDGKLDSLEDEWFYNDKWLHVDIVVLKRDENNLPIYIGGILYDITDKRISDEFYYMNTIYELAIESGQIGIFFYDIDKYGERYFDANQIYADLVGLDKKDNGYYLVDDFEKALLGIEEEIQEDSNIQESLNKLLKGDIEGTDNQIIKLQHLKTDDILYFLSSSRIEERYENGNPRKLGGIIIDVTDRIQHEKHQIEFANRDELTGLFNNRKLMKDMTKRNDGIGLFFDLDNFKKFNDTYGHQTGDEVLYEFSQSLKEAALPYDKVYVYRLYGDEFFIFAEGQDKNFAKMYEKALKQRLKERIESYGFELILEASMGYSLFTRGMDIDDFIKEADYAMYEIKIDKKKTKKPSKLS